MSMTLQLRTIHRTAAAALVGLLAVLVGCTDDSDWQAAPTADATEGAAAPSGQVQVLFALDAPSATVGIQGAEHTITMQEPSDVLAFTDRPVREAQRGSVATLVEAWRQLFGDDPPNAALSAVTPDGFSVDVPVELTSISSTNDRVVFTARRIDDGERAAVPSDLESVSLFIDDAAACPPMSEGDGAQELCSTELVYASTFVPFDSSF